jgi:uncharacterized protein (DUF924 family)
MYEDVLTFWFGTLDASGCADAAHAERWWKKNQAFDEELRHRFGPLHEAVANGDHDDWLSSPRGRLAYVIVLDQFSRNMFRDTARMYAYDDLALAAARNGIVADADKMLKHDERIFLYMPFQHSEDLADQELAVALFERMTEGLSGDDLKRAEDNVVYAERHRDIVKSFGRFPHRNRLLGRATTPEEAQFLTQPNSSFLILSSLSGEEQMFEHSLTATLRHKTTCLPFQSNGIRARRKVMDAYLQSAAQLRELAARVTNQEAKERMLAFAQEYEAMSANAANQRRRSRRRIPNVKEPLLSPLEQFVWRGNA